MIFVRDGWAAIRLAGRYQKLIRARVTLRPGTRRQRKASERISAAVPESRAGEKGGRVVGVVAEEGPTGLLGERGTVSPAGY